MSKAKKSSRKAKKVSLVVIRRISGKSIARNQIKFGGFNEKASTIEVEVKEIESKIAALGEVGNNLAKQVEYATLKADLVSRQGELERVSSKAKKVGGRVIAACKKNATITAKKTGFSFTGVLNTPQNTAGEVRRYKFELRTHIRKKSA